MDLSILRTDCNLDICSAQINTDCIVHLVHTPLRHLLSSLRSNSIVREPSTLPGCALAQLSGRRTPPLVSSSARILIFLPSRPFGRMNDACRSFPARG